MEEDEYKSTYDKLASVRCVFEKALTNHQAKCSKAKHFCLADREGYSCESIELSSKCCEILENLRKNSVFVLKLQEVKGPLPHNMEIRVQAGGMLGLAKLLHKTEISDICQVIDQVETKFGGIEDLPFNEIIQSVVQFQGRRRRQK